MNPRWVEQPVAKTPLPLPGDVRVYQIDCDVNHYQSLEVFPRAPENKKRYPIEVERSWGKLQIDREPYEFKGREMPEDWVPVPLRPVDKSKRPHPDVWFIWSTYCFAMNPKAYSLVEEEFEKLGQVLTAPYEGEDLKILNLLHKLDCLDTDACQWDEYDEGCYEFLAMGAEQKIVFDPKQLDDALVFTFVQRQEDYFCVERTGDPATEFKALIEANGITGLSFELIWEGKG